MKKIFLAPIVAALALSSTGCGNSVAQTQNSISDAIRDNFVGAPYGVNNVTLRDSSKASGGIFGYVSSATTTHLIAGENVKSFEWANLTILDNYARAGENVAAYFQANKFGAGSTWGAVTEIADRSDSNSGVVTHEFDMWTSGLDTGNRIGLDVVIGDVKLIRGTGKSPVTEGTAAVRIGGAVDTKWIAGLQIKDRVGVAIDVSKAVTPTAIRLGPGQAVEFAPGVTLAYKDGKFVFYRDGQIVASF